MRKMIFIYLLKGYSKTEKGRVEILKHLDEGIYDNYYEQTTFGNVYNFFIEFVIANKFIKDRVAYDDKDSLDMIKRGIDKAFDEGVKFINKEN
jgi:hypothetical protein